MTFELQVTPSCIVALDLGFTRPPMGLGPSFAWASMQHRVISSRVILQIQYIMSEIDLSSYLQQCNQLKYNPLCFA